MKALTMTTLIPPKNVMNIMDYGKMNGTTPGGSKHRTSPLIAHLHEQERTMSTVSIPLTHGKFALIDEEDFPLVSRFKWHARQNHGNWYAYANTGEKANKSLHQLILNTPPRQGVDHKNGDGLDNRRVNIRPCTNSQNAANRKRESRNTSGYRGVSWHKRIEKWQARIKFQGKTIPLGYFETPIDAACAYDAKAREVFGEFANPNFEEAAH